MSEESRGVKVLDWHSTTHRVPSPFRETQIKEKTCKRYAKALLHQKKKNLSFHNKVFDLAKGKFRDVATIKEATVVGHNSNLFVEKGNKLGRMDAEVDLLLY